MKANRHDATSTMRRAFIASGTGFLGHTSDLDRRACRASGPPTKAAGIVVGSYRVFEVRSLFVNHIAMGLLIW